MVNINLNYCLDDLVDKKRIKENGLTDLEIYSFIHSINELMKTREQLRLKYPELEVNIFMSMGKELPDLLVCVDGDKTEVKEALHSLITKQMIPRFVSGCYDIVNPVLERYGKTTKREFFGLLVGKSVANIK